MRNFLLPLCVVVCLIFSPLDSFSLVLNDVVRIALRTNPQVQSSLEGINQANAGVWEAYSSFLPTVTASRTMIYNDPEVIIDMGPPELGLGSVVMTPKEIKATGLEITQPIFNGGVIWLGKSMAELGKDTKLIEYQKTLQDVSHGAMTAYLQLYETQELARVAEEALKSMKEHYRVTQTLFDVGIVSQSDLLRLEAALAELEQGVLAANDGVQLSKSALNLALGRDQLTPIEIEDPGKVSPIQYSLNELIEQAPNTRPDLKSLAIAVELTKKQVQMESSALYPNLNFVANYSKTDDAIGFSTNTSSWSYTLVASYKLPVGLGNVARITGAKAQLNALEKQYELARMGAELEIRAAQMAYQTAINAIEPTTKGNESAQENLRLIEIRYREGAASQVEYLDAQVAATEADSRLIQNRIKINKAIIDLKKAAGILEIPAEFNIK